MVWYQTIKNNYKTLLLSFFSIFCIIKDNDNLFFKKIIVWYQTTVMISINVIIFSIYMFCEVYRSHPEDSGGGRISAGYPADIRRREKGSHPADDQWASSAASSQWQACMLINSPCKQKSATDKFNYFHDGFLGWRNVYTIYFFTI